MPQKNPPAPAKPDIKSFINSFHDHILHSLGKDKYSATELDRYQSLAYTVREKMFEDWSRTQQAYYDDDVKRVYYLSLEFLIGRTLGNSLINTGLEETAEGAMNQLGHSLRELEDKEWDAGLGNGGLGRLAACFLDSMATLGIPAYGYGIHYQYGIFFQKIVNGQQIETPDSWLRYGNPWEIGRPEYLYPVQFYGRVHEYYDAYGSFRSEWTEAEKVMAMAYDIPVPGYGNNIVNTLRLWEAKSTRDFNLADFNQGDYVGAVEHKTESENISKVLYPNDSSKQGRELRLKQEYFFVSATLQDVLRRYKKHRGDFDQLPEKVAIQLNDTHPAIAIPEMMRLLVDGEGLIWDRAWDITTRVFGYTNHTILPEALERWSVEMMGRVLPRHLLIIYEINRRFLDEIKHLFPGDNERLQRMSLIEEGAAQMVRMANLAIVGSHSVNGVSALHSDLLKTRLFKDFYEIWPERFNNKTNGITQRRWLRMANPGLSRLITEKIGDGWIVNLDLLKQLEAHADDTKLQAAWHEVKRQNKLVLADYIRQNNHIEVDPNSLFDVQVKRLHEYKRQLLNILHVITLYNRIKDNPGGDFVPRTVIFGAKAAPGYYMAKLIIRLINNVAEVVNNDNEIGSRLKVVFLANYGVSLAEKIMPAADLSEQISTAGLEASGTGNMKFSLNGALTIGTLDGANIEIKEEVGDDNIFIFGLTAEEIADIKPRGYDPGAYYKRQPQLQRVLDMIAQGAFSPDEPDRFHAITDGLRERDPYFLMADYAAYIECQDRVSATYENTSLWTKMAILNVARMGKFSSDRTIKEYATEIWDVPVSATP